MKKKILFTICLVTILLFNFSTTINAVQNQAEVSIIGRKENNESKVLLEVDGDIELERTLNNLEIGLEYNLKEYTGDTEREYYLKPRLITEEKYPAFKNTWTGIEFNYQYNQDENLFRAIPYIKFKRQLTDRTTGTLRTGWRFKEGDVSQTELLVEPEFHYKNMLTQTFVFGIDSEADIFKVESDSSWKDTYEIKPYFRQEIPINNKLLIGEINYKLKEDNNQTNIKLGVQF